MMIGIKGDHMNIPLNIPFTHTPIYGVPFIVSVWILIACGGSTITVGLTLTIILLALMLTKKIKPW